MKLLVISHTPHWKDGTRLAAYGPYVREMNLWFAHCDAITVVAPLATKGRSDIHTEYDREDVQLKSIPSVYVGRFRESVKTLFKIPIILYVIGKEMRRADHIHLRCPGNIGLLGVLVQILFPAKSKTVKYAGNWDPKSKQPLSYRIQKRLVSSTTLSKNLKVLVYGEWREQSKNIIPFFTASYGKGQKERIEKTFTETISFVFVGSLVAGKRPDYALALVDALSQKGLKVHLDVYGDGGLRPSLEERKGASVSFHGNQKASVVQAAYKKAHFVLLPSKSEGWPKVVAEGMFFGAIPIVTPISCVPWMLDQGRRGILLKLDLEHDIKAIAGVIAHKERYRQMSATAQQWSQQYTLDSFENAIKTLLV